MARNIFVKYLEWYFSENSRVILQAWRNCLKFNLNYWSVPLLFKTLFSPWRRYQYSYGKGFSFGKYFEVFTFNITSRLIGAIMRSVLIVIGTISEVFIFSFGLAIFLIWLILPFLIIFSFIYGFKILLY